MTEVYAYEIDIVLDEFLTWRREEIIPYMLLEPEGEEDEQKSSSGVLQGYNKYVNSPYLGVSQINKLGVINNICVCIKQFMSTSPLSSASQDSSGSSLFSSSSDIDDTMSDFYDSQTPNAPFISETPLTLLQESVWSGIQTLLCEIVIANEEKGQGEGIVNEPSVENVTEMLDEISLVIYQFASMYLQDGVKTCCFGLFSCDRTINEPEPENVREFIDGFFAEIPSLVSKEGLVIPTDDNSSLRRTVSLN